MAEQLSSAQEQAFAQLVGRIFTDDKFAQALEKDPQQAIKSAGIDLNDNQLRALATSRVDQRMVASSDGAQVAAFVRPVVSVLTKGTRPAVSVVVSSAVVATTDLKADDDRTR